MLVPITTHLILPIGFGVLTLSGTFAAGQIGVIYSSSLAITGGNAPYSNPLVTVGTIPAGLTLSVVGATLKLSGTPTGPAGTINITVSVDSNDGQTATSAQTFAIAAAATFAVWGTTRHPSAIVLSGGNRAASVPTYAGRNTVAADVSKNTGKWLFEVNVTGLSSGDNNWLIGICAQETGYADPWGAAGLGDGSLPAASIGYFPYDGTVLYKSDLAPVAPSSSAGTGYTPGTSVVFTVAVDLTSATKTIKWFVGNSLKRTFNIPTAMAARDWIPAASPLFAGSVFTINSGQTTIAIPTPLAGLGYNAFWK